MMVQYDAIKAEHPDKIVFFRMGDFYEMFRDDAVEAASILGLTLTSRSKGDQAIPMAGVPCHACERYLKILLEAGKKVAICDQLEDPSVAKGLVRRGVTRIITPGTILEESCLSSREYNFLAAVHVEGREGAIAFVDISTGDFFYTLLPAAMVGDELERISPAETLIPERSCAKGGKLEKALPYRSLGTLTEREARFFDRLEGARRLREHFGVATLEGFGLDERSAAVGAAGAVLHYLQETQQQILRHLHPPRRIDRRRILLLDAATQRHLELFRPLREGGERTATLRALLDRTQTGPGGRLLTTWILHPLAELEPILARQEAVAELMNHALLRQEIREILAEMADLERITGRVVTGRATARDLVALAKGSRKLQALRPLREEVQAELLRTHLDLDPFEDLREAIEKTLVEDPPLSLREGGLIRRGVHEELDMLHALAGGGKDWIAAFQAREQARTGIPSLKIGFNRVFGYYIEVTNVHKDKVPPDYIRKQTLANAERFITPELKEREQQVLGAEERIAALEYELFTQLRDRVASQSARIQQAAQSVAIVDVLASLAEVSAVRRYTMPTIREDLSLTIRNGRHPVLEAVLPEGTFVPNDLVVDPDHARIFIITGPNMAGKSTFLRQCALLVILAQMGCGVPAEAMELGLVDRIFTRIGAVDDLARGQSTFMVEMSETAHILRQATERSLLILDEVGRGTSTFDGVSLAWAITEYIHHQIRARTLFATHYHELAELGGILDRAKNLNVAVRDWGGEIIFLHTIQEGSCDRSYGIQVARLAGLPPEVIERAREILLGLESQAAERDWKYLQEAEVLRAAAREVQLDLFSSLSKPTSQPKTSSKVEEILAAVDLDRLTPEEAFQLIHRLIALVRSS